MNANELANWIEKGAPYREYETAKQTVIMLRQQQAEIEALKKENEELSHLCFEFGILRKVQGK